MRDDELVILVIKIGHRGDIHRARRRAKATLAASSGDRLARGRRHRNIICQTQTLAAQERDATAA